MLETFQNLRASFWNEDVWTPPNATWALYEESGYRHFNDIYYSIYTAVVIVIVRLTLDRFVFAPFGIWMGLKPTKVRPPPPNDVLEKSFRLARGKVDPKQIVGLAKQLDLSEREVQRWLRLRAFQNRPTVLSKFTEGAWRCTFYSCLFLYGLFVLWDKPWMWDTVYCFLEFPVHYVSDGEWWYYNIECGFYLSLLFSQFFDVQRKDFWVMFIHHVVTLVLMAFSWACNMVRIGTLVMVIHDFADIPLEGAKLLSYLKKTAYANTTFTVFACCWVLSRICVLPYRIIYFTSYVALGLVPMFSAYYIFNALLIALQTLHIIWTYFIIRVSIHAWNNNGIKDIRSEDESELDESDQSSSSNGTESTLNSKSYANNHNGQTTHKILSDQNGQKKSESIPYLNGEACKISSNGTSNMHSLNDARL